MSLSCALLPRVITAGLALALFPSCQLPKQAQQWVTKVTAAVRSPAPEVRRAMSVDQGDIFRAPREFNVPSGNTTITDTARLLAGLPAAGRDSFARLRASDQWQAHQRKMTELWSNFAWRHQTPIQNWAATETSDLQGAGGLFYPFSGPDFLFAHTFFPHADTIVLCGLEPCEPLPPLAQLSGPEIASGLDGIVTSVSTAMQFSFFITKDMRRDLVSTRFRGVLPLILAFMAGTGHSIESVDLVRLDGNGTPVLAQASNQAPGVMIRAISPSGQLRRVFYFRQDLSDESLNPGSPLLRFASSLGSPPAFVKSASYLMHESGFSNIRNYLTTNCRAIVQDPSGVPYRNLLGAGLDIRLYGNYQGTLEMFAEHNQPDLIQAYSEGRHGARPISFGVGYMFDPSRTSLMVARRNGGLSLSW